MLQKVLLKCTKPQPKKDKLQKLGPRNANTLEIYGDKFAKGKQTNFMAFSA